MNKARRIVAAGMITSMALAAMKLLAGWKGHSAAVLADGFESAGDVFISALVLVGMIVASRPADEDHPYGHGRIETLAGLLLGFCLFAAGGAIAWHGWTGAASPGEPPHAWAVIPMAISVAAKSWLTVVKRHHAREIGSASLDADAANDAVDILSGVVALGALSLTLLSPRAFARADHYGAAAVGVIVMAAALRVMYDASLLLIDTMPGEEAIGHIRRVAMSVEDVQGVEKCFARRTGLKYHVDLHLEVDPDITVRASHDIAERTRNRIKGELPWVADVLVHVEPWPGLRNR